MEKERIKSLIKYFIITIIISIFGLNNVMASEKYYDLGNLNSNTTFYIIDNSPVQAPQEMPIGQEWNFEDYDIYSFLINFDNYLFKKDNKYRITLTLPRSIITNANSYSVTTSNGETCSTGLIEDMDTNYPKFSFLCGVDTDRLSLKIFNSNDYPIINNRWWFTWSNIQLDRIGDTSDLINCRLSKNILKLIPLKQSIAEVTNTNVILNGTLSEALAIKVGEVSLKAHTTYTFESFRVGNNLSSYFLINQYGDTIYLTQDNMQFIVTNNNTYEFYFIIQSGTYSSVNFKPMITEGNKSLGKFEPFGEEICQNKIDETNDKLDQTNDKLNDIEGALTDSSPTDMSGLGDSAGWLPPGPVDSIINLPLTFFLNLSESLTSECRPVELTLPFVNKNIELPCMNSIYEKIGITGIGGFYSWVGLICSAVILFNYLLDLYHWVDKTLTMRENTMPGYYEDKWGGGA